MFGGVPYRLVPGQTTAASDDSDAPRGVGIEGNEVFSRGVVEEDDGTVRVGVVG